jgi:hypothetical protein
MASGTEDRVALPMTKSGHASIRTLVNTRGRALRLAAWQQTDRSRH